MTRMLNDFAGSWTIKRDIDDRLGGSGRFEGQALLEPYKGGLRYAEKGTLTLNTGASMRAERIYHWQQDGRLIAVTFEDGRAFHRFDPSLGGAGDRHYCDPDIYDVIYAFEDWPTWSSHWTVKGPRKDYVMRSVFSRLPEERR
jgi:hypothetical protein